MTKVKYKFNPKTLQYEEIKPNLKNVFIKSLPYTICLILFAAGFTYIYDKYFETPEKQRLKTENTFLTNNLESIQEKLAIYDEEMNKLAEKDNDIFRVIYQMDSIPSQVRNSGFGGVNKYAKLKGHERSELVIDVSQRLDKLNKKLEIQQFSYGELTNILKRDSDRNHSLPVIQPIHNKDLTRLGSHFGMRLHPILKIYRIHNGIDLTAPTGTPVFASGDGKVIRVDHNRSRRGYGNLVVIDHGYDGLSTRYAHLESMSVKVGQRVTRGQQIGTVGNTGLSTGPHLHYEIRKEGKAVNPLYYILELTPNQYDELVRISKLPGKSFD